MPSNRRFTLPEVWVKLEKAKVIPMLRTGSKNSLTDVHGILVGHHTDREAASGVSVVLCPEGAVAGVDVRGAAPGTRETDLLKPENLIDRIHTVVFTGGSVYGLAAADGVVRWLWERGKGYAAGNGLVVPIVPAAVLFDLGRGRDPIPPITADWGKSACAAAASGRFDTGSVGAGTGAVAGGIKGGVGTASENLSSGYTVAGMAVVNSWGTVIDPQTGQPWEIGQEIAGEFGPAAKRRVLPPQISDPGLLQNTTLGLVATDAALSKAQALRIAQMAHAGLTRAIRPAHSMLDGDTVFCLAVENPDLRVKDAIHVQILNRLGESAARCMSRAIIHAVLGAGSLGGVPAFGDLPPRP
jgi:L-aminopeptidase/D-esterase-like protein